MKKALLFLLLFPVCVFAQQQEVFRIDNLPKEGILLDKGWKWHAGDNPEWAKSAFDDADWEKIDPSKDVVQFTNISTDQPLWLRIKLSPHAAENYALSIAQSGASEIYLNGRLIQKIGQIDPSNQHSKAYNPLDDHLILRLDSLNNTLAIRYYFQHGLNLDPIYNIRYPFFSARIFDSKYIIASHKSYFWPGFNMGFAFILFFIHGVLFLYYPPLRANFWLSAWAFINTLFSYFLFQLEINPYLERNAQYVFSAMLMSLIGTFCLLYCIYLLLESKRKIYVYLFVVLIFSTVIIYYLYGYATRDMLWFVVTIFQTILTVAMAIDANRQRSRSGMPVLFGTLAYLLFWTLFITGYELTWAPIYKDILFHLATLSFPVTMSALLGFKFRQVNQSLLHNLQQVNQLYAEKQQILSSQNETLEKQVQERTAELEYKNRDLEIEAALEKVRTRALEMQKSDEVMDVADILYEQLQYLGFKYGACTIMIMDAETGDAEHWVAGFDHRKYPESYHVPYFKHPCCDAQLAAWRNGDDFLVYHLEGAEKKSYDAVMFHQTDFKNFPDAEKKWMSEIESVDFTLAYMKNGALHWGPGLLPEEQSVILQRFAKVFEQAYTRFLDLQKAEEQAREAQIEAALERVRSRTMAMQKSEQLVEVINVVAAQLLQLNFRLNTASFFLNNESEDFTFWLAAIGESNPEKIVIPNLSNPALDNIKEAQKNGVDFWADNLSFEEKNKWFEHVFAHSPGRVPEDRQQYILNTKGYARSVVLMKQIGLFIVNYEPQPYTDAENAIFKRFAFAFEQAYTRFLDLQKAEVQAREAQIEVALERVRSKSISMTTTEEIGNIIFTLFSELRKLDLALDRSFIITFDADLQGMVYWMAGPEGLLSQNGFHIPLFDHPFNHALIDNFKKKTEKWGFLLEGETKKAWDDIAFVDSDLSQLPDFIKDSMINYGDVAFSLSSMGYGTILVAGREQVNAAQFDLILRFSRVFEQTYTRFLDLKQAEAQAREAQIEAALEKIRSRSLAMRHSGELKDVISIMFEKLKELNVLLGTIAIVLFDEKSRDCFFWIGNDLHDEPPLINLPYDENIFEADTFLKDCWQARLTGKGFVNNKYSFERKNKYFEYVFANNNFEVFPQSVRDFIMQAQDNIACLIVENNSTLFVDSWNGQTYSDEMLKVIKRAAAVFEQAFVRFLDLQKAEAQAREAQIEAALERVRSKAMSMQTSEEINAVIGKIFTECKSLEIQLDSSIIIIYDKQTLNTNWYLTNNEDPDYPACFSVPNNEYPFNTAMLDAWHQKTVDWSYMLDVQEKKEWDKFMFSKTDFVLLPENLKEVMAAVEKLYIKASFNEFGCIMLSSLEPLNNEQMAILPRFSKVFELTYTRFNDLKIAEAQAEQAKLDLIQIQTEKKKAEDTLVELRATQAQLIQSEKLASLGELTAGIAHEIQNPLNFVNNFSELSVELLEEMETEFKAGKSHDAFEIAADLKQNLSKINHHGQRASAIVKGMLEHSRMSSGTKVATDINALADEYLRLAYHGLRAKDSSFNATMETHFDPELPKIEVIPQDIGRVLLNLINNAFYAVNQRNNAVETLHAMSLPYQPTVTIATRKLENTIEISVKDNGNGIPENIKDKIFQPFFTTKPTGQGTGLGLSLAYDIVTKGHGGTLTVTSIPGAETTFELQLPMN
jgi:signal transduction histidine kinase